MAMIRRLKVACLFLLLAVCSLLTNYYFNYISNENVITMMNPKLARDHHNKLCGFDEKAAQEKRLKVGSSHSTVAKQSQYEQIHKSRKNDSEEVERGNSEDYSKLGVKKVYYKHEFEPTKNPNPSTHSVGSLSLHNISPSQPVPAHHVSQLALISQKAHTNPTAHRDIAVHNSDGQNNNEQRSDMVDKCNSPSATQVQLTQSHGTADQHIAQTKIQELQTSHSNFNKNGGNYRSDLVKGFTIKSNKSLLERGFRMDYGFDSAELLQRRRHITVALEGVSEQQRDMAGLSLNANLLERGKHQYEQMQRYCKSENMSASLPENFMELKTLFRHLLYDDSKKIVFCYVPKNSCSNMKRMMLILNSIIPKNSSLEKQPPESVIRMVHSFNSLSREGAIYRLENDFKFNILRNPMERLVSAYRNKLEKPLNYTRVKQFPDRLKASILELMRKSAFQEWVELKNYSKDIHPSFSDSLDYLTKFPFRTLNEHFLPFMNLCSPCAIKYDVFLNLKILKYDIFALMEYLRIPFHYFPDVFRSLVTRDLVEEYYHHVSQKLKTRVFVNFAKEIEFYYNMFPEDV